MEKIFKTINEQVEILKDKGLIIEDELEAKEILLRENYFFIMGYRHLLCHVTTKANSFPERPLMRYMLYLNLIEILGI